MLIYQIYPRSFADSNADGIGDLNGITSRLDYLAGLGVDALWLSPIYPSPDVDFGYDVSDYTGVDPRFGTLDDFDRLVQQARQRGIGIILDLVLNHTSDQHPWFLESRSNRSNPKRDWFLWRDPAPGGGPPNNWQSVFGGSGWALDPATGQYYFHMFYKEQPDVNWHNPAVRQAMLDVFRFWLDRGVDGFRLDVFNVYFKDAQFRSNPRVLGLPFYGFSRQKHIYDCDRPEMLPLLREIRALVDRYQAADGRPRYVVGETFLSGADKSAAYCGADLLHAAFNFEFLSARPRPRDILQRIRRWEQALGDVVWPNYVLSNHDVRRLASRWARAGRPEEDARLKLAAALLLTLRGTPYLYYGEEIGMRDIPIRRREDVLDPIGKRFWPLMKGRDGCRSPMQWDASPNAGFTTAGARPWLPLHENFLQRNVAAQQQDPASLWNFFQRLIALRRELPALQKGMFQPLTEDTRYLLAYLRQTGSQMVLVALNFSGRRQRLVLGSHLARQRWKLLLSSHRETLAEQPGSMLRLEPFEAILLAMEE
jgi:alpha-glucosidase